MLNELITTIDNSRHRFLANGTVQRLDNNGSINATGSWRAPIDTTQRQNLIRYQVEGQPDNSLEVVYDFNSENQLVVTIPIQDGVLLASDPATFMGGIRADDRADIEYVCYKSDTEKTGIVFHVHGDLTLTEKADELVMELTSDAQGIRRTVSIKRKQVHIVNGNQESTLAASTTPDGLFDLFRFIAETFNEMDDGDFFFKTAQLDFAGRWDFYKDQLVFIAKADLTDDLSKPDLYVAFAGKVKGTAYGLELNIVDGAVESLGFAISGAYQWNDRKLKWDVTLGVSTEGQFEAEFEFESSDVTPNGRNGKLTISGKFSLKKTGVGGDSGYSFAGLRASLGMTYKFDSGKVELRISVEGRSYKLNVSGNLKVGDNHIITFEIQYNSETETGKIVLNFGSTDDDSTLKVNVEIIIGPNGLSINIGLNIRIVFTEFGIADISVVNAGDN